MYYHFTVQLMKFWNTIKKNVLWHLTFTYVMRSLLYSWNYFKIQLKKIVWMTQLLFKDLYFRDWCLIQRSDIWRLDDSKTKGNTIVANITIFVMSQYLQPIYSGFRTCLPQYFFFFSPGIHTHRRQWFLHTLFMQFSHEVYNLTSLLFLFF